MSLSIPELAKQYLAEAEHLGELIERAKRFPNPNILDQERRLTILRTMRRENYEIYRHLLWLSEPKDKPSPSAPAKKPTRRTRTHKRPEGVHR